MREMNPRPYQTQIIADIRSEFRAGRNRVLLVSPTGSGKTVIFSLVTLGAIQKGNLVWIITHRNEILAQISKTLRTIGVDHGIIAAGTPHNAAARVQVASIGTLSKRLGKFPKPDLVIIDESHHSVAKSWCELFAYLGTTKVLGVTATPERLDGRGLGDIFESMVLGPSVSWLIENRFLAQPIYYAPRTVMDFSKVRKVAGDYSKSEVEAMLDKPSITGDVIKHYRFHLDGRTAVAFCVSIRHAEAIAKSFTAAGIPAAVIEGKQSDTDRKRVIDDLATGRIKVLASCELISEGFDLPSVNGAILLRPTESLAMYLQQVGRALRPKQDGSEAVILDHVGNLRHGLAEEAREWTLEGRAKQRRSKESILDTRQCESCFRIFTGTLCPECGATRQSKARELEIREGELQRIEAAEFAAQRAAKIELRMAKSLEEYQRIGRERGYHPNWAIHRWKFSSKNPENHERKQNPSGNASPVGISV